MENAELTPIHFHLQEDFNLREHLARSFGVFCGDGHGDVRVKVRFSPAVARYVPESHWHGSQKLTPQKDGSLLAEFELDNTEEIKRWIQSFGKQAVVIEPDALRREMIDELDALRHAYGASRTVGGDTGLDGEASSSPIAGGPTARRHPGAKPR